ncbi:uncharacterized protein PAC_11279 [Phialocephala subalpina]|uniref:Uncharacterized protein n=1 Tax=Phialocephala subalpina TaxID=576137 RepID=A0A1L7X8N5_9HELO|nr:uncharacterized protein PAC_11279 [Phialocephala subalpina]
MADNEESQVGSYIDDDEPLVYYQYNGGSYGAAQSGFGDVNPGTDSGPSAPETQSGPQDGQQ